MENEKEEKQLNVCATLEKSKILKNTNSESVVFPYGLLSAALFMHNVPIVSSNRHHVAY